MPAQPARGNFTPPRYDAAPAATAAQPDPATVPAPSGGRFSPRNWRVPTRLNAILLIPVIVALVVGGFNVKNSLDQWQQADDALRTANLVRAAETYSNDLINERDVSVVPLLKGDTKNPQVVAARNAADQAARAFNAAVAQMPDVPDLRRRLATFRKVEPELAQLRQNAYTSKLPAVQTEEGYVAVQHPLMEFANDLGFGTNNLTSYGRTLYAISLAKAAESLTRSIGEHILVEGQISPTDRKTQLTALASYAYLEQIALQEYEGGGTPDDMTRLQQAQADAQRQGQAQLAAAKQQAQAAGQPFVAPPDLATMVKAIASGASPSALKAQGITPDSYFASATLGFNAYRSVEQHLADQAATDAASLASSAKTDAIINSAAVLAGVLLAFVVAALMARSMSRSMQRLRSSAFEVAEQQLPALVDQLSRTDPGRVDTRVTPIPINTGDEIGEVARAFDQVHREAVRLAAEQALLRGNVNAIFTNLSLRNQGLIQRQLSLITELENNEADPDQLENLFHLDHLATRMRRNGENLLVLAGEEPGRRWNQPVPLVDVLRAAASEVESYERIEINGVPETEIHGAAVTDLVHLLAELLENATSFSSPQTKVRVTATRLPDGRLMVEILDKGIGLTPEDFADINHKLADPPTVDASVSQRMGLFVVGRLAARHGIRVQLRPSGEQAGTTSLVMLPEAITHGGGGEEMEESDFTVSRIVPEHFGDTYQGGNLTAAELGFDDRRYEVPDDARELDPVGRSLMREERRAALEAATERRQQPDERPLFRDEAPAAPPARAPSYEEQDEYQQYEGYEQQSYEESYEQSYDQPYEQRRTDYPDYSEYSQYTDFVPHQQSYETNGSQNWDDDLPAYRQDYTEHQEAETSRSAPWTAPDHEPEVPDRPHERVGYDAPDAGPSNGNRLLTDAGLPRRERQWQQPETAEPQRETASESLRDGDRGEDQGGQGDAAQWRSANDEHWQRADQARKPRAGGVTASGLPRRVPRANLVPGAAHQTLQGGPQVSRAPEDIRGRLANLRRGVQQGRSAGSDATSTPTDSQGHGPNHQER
ncbi:nitrate- and nitrite sensing domain-containing protein [Streptomyces sp. RB6PN25]|uniref:histidine kinase n=1 Tax=Streptomyces humicola TaxID=2953240 RepID=A0ABT1Q4W0_9ACTN|nr:nitrate- and nitrite sensing domain-containing protein [Streptomyces humicola]MCQ4084932.1 nitrate- and nitrite sensing domain-containing protein [Streptomyces humicola]